jgi:hypothetical protein
MYQIIARANKSSIPRILIICIGAILTYYLHTSLLVFRRSIFALSFKESLGPASIHISFYDRQYTLDIGLGGGQPITNSCSLLVLGEAVNNKLPVAKAFIVDGVQNLQCMGGRTSMKGMV